MSNEKSKIVPDVEMSICEALAAGLDMIAAAMSSASEQTTETEVSK